MESHAVFDSRLVGRPVQLPPEPRRKSPVPVRCLCKRCGSHVKALAYARSVSGECSTCGSYDILPLAR